jgi:hypothetical protein
MTRFDDFLRARGIQPAVLARRCSLNRSTSLSRMTIYRVRKTGTCSARTKRKLVIMCQRMSGERDVTLPDLFDDWTPPE